MWNTWKLLGSISESPPLKAFMHMTASCKHLTVHTHTAWDWYVFILPASMTRVKPEPHQADDNAASCFQCRAPDVPILGEKLLLDIHQSSWGRNDFPHNNILWGGEWKFSTTHDLSDLICSLLTELLSSWKQSRAAGSRLHISCRGQSLTSAKTNQYFYPAL